jgi:hypothetical protein
VSHEAPDTVHVTEATEAPTVATLIIDVSVTDDGGSALMMAHAEPPGAARAVGDAVEAMPRAAAALAAAGVVHGIDGAAVGETLAAADGVPRPVAFATPATPPVDASIVLLHADALRSDPLFTVPAGTAIARREPPREGSPGTDVTGHRVEPPEPRIPDLEAGDGARVVEAGCGALEAYATVDGRPSLSGVTICVESAVRAQGIPAAAVHEVFGTLVVQGDLGEGARVSATGSVVVGGLVAQARVDGEAGVAVTGSCVGSRVRAGAHQAACRRVHAELSAAIEELALLDAAAEQLVAGSAGSARPIPEEAALRVLVERRFTGVPERWEEAAKVVRADGESALMSREGREAVAAMARAVGDLLSGGRLARADLAHVREAVAIDMERLGSAGAAGAEVRAAYLQACHVEASGGLTVTGSGTYNTDAVIGGDLVAEAPGATVRGGEFHVGGSVRAAELGAPGEARVVIVLTGPPRPGVRLAAAVAHAGVEIVMAGRQVRIDRTTLNLALGCDEENRVVRSGELAG